MRAATFVAILMLLWQTSAVKATGTPSSNESIPGETMSVDPRQGRPYQPPPDQYPTDNVPVTPVPQDSGFTIPANGNPDGSDAGPLYASPEAERWLQENVADKGLVIDWGTREIFDPETGEVKGIVPKFFDRMM